MCLKSMLKIVFHFLILKKSYRKRYLPFLQITSMTDDLLMLKLVKIKVEEVVVDVEMVETENAMIVNQEVKDAHREDEVILVLETEVIDVHQEDEVILVLETEVTDEVLEETQDLLDDQKVVRSLTDQDVQDVEIKYINLVTIVLRGFFKPSC